MKIAIDKQAFTMAEKATAESLRNEWKSDLTPENVRTAARWIMQKTKLPANVLVSIENITVTKLRGNAAIEVNAIMRGVNMFVDVAFDFCAAIMEDENALNTASIEIFKRA